MVHVERIILEILGQVKLLTNVDFTCFFLLLLILPRKCKLEMRSVFCFYGRMLVSACSFVSWENHTDVLLCRNVRA